MNEVVVMEDGSPIPQEAVLVIRNEDIAQLLIQRYKEENALRESRLREAINVASKPIVKLYQKWVRLTFQAYMETHGKELQALIAEINKFSIYSYRLSLKPREKLKGYNGYGTLEGLSLEAAAHLVDTHNPLVERHRHGSTSTGLKRFFNLYGVSTGTTFYMNDRSALSYVEEKRVTLGPKLKVPVPVERVKFSKKEEQEIANRYGNLPEECKFPILLKKQYFEISVTDEMRAVFAEIQDVLHNVLKAGKAYCENQERANEDSLQEFSQRVRARVTEYALQDLDIKEHMLSIYDSAVTVKEINLLTSDKNFREEEKEDSDE